MDCFASHGQATPPFTHTPLPRWAPQVHEWYSDTCVNVTSAQLFARGVAELEPSRGPFSFGPPGYNPYERRPAYGVARNLGKPPIDQLRSYFGGNVESWPAYGCHPSRFFPEPTRLEGIDGAVRNERSDEPSRHGGRAAMAMHTATPQGGGKPRSRRRKLRRR